jgi:DNA ligase-1
VRRFAALYAELDASTATSAKLDALQRYYAAAPAADAAWATYFLAGGKPRQAVPTALLRATATQAAGIDEWLFDECYQAVGDLAETIALVLPPPARRSDAPLADWVERRLLPLRGLDAAEQQQRLRAMWDELDTHERFLLGKLIGGGFRVGVSRLLVQRALGRHAGLDAKLLAQRMIGYVDAKALPDGARFAALLAPHDAASPRDAGQPYPFFLAHALELPLAQFDAALGAPSGWQVEWKYDGIRAQLVRRGGRACWWSRGEELITDRFPELAPLADALPDGCVLDGEIVVWKDERPAPFALLQQRIGRKTLTRKLLADAPARFIAYDLLELDGVDRRGEPTRQRRERLEALALVCPLLTLSPLVERDAWPTLAALRTESRARGVEGLMLKQRDGAYGSGRTKADGVWWKWKIDPMSVDAVLVYAQAGHGRRASVYTDYTFAVWNRAPRDADETRVAVDAVAAKRPPPPDALQLVPFAKAYSGLTDEEFRRIDRVVRASTIEKFGPVRSVKPALVFELGFEGIALSARHKSGIAVRFPRMLRIRDDKPLHEADSLAQLHALLAQR